MGVIRGHDHHRRPCSRAAVAGHRPLLPTQPRRSVAVPASRTAPPWWASSTSCAPGALAAAAGPRARLRQPGHLLAAPAGLATRRRLAAAPPAAAGRTRPPGPAGLSRASLDSLSVRAKRGLPDRPNPTDRGKPRSKDHLLTDRCGIPLAVGLSAANTHYSVLEAMVDAVPAIRGPRGRPGRPRKRPAGPSALRGGAVAGVAGRLPAVAGAL